VRATPAEVVGRPFPEASTPPTAWVVLPTGAALVVGSTQPPPRPGEQAVVRRRSGGGAVLVAPTSPLWVEVFVPTGDGLSSRQVDRAAWWLGEAWAEALAAVGVVGARVHRGGLEGGPWSRAVCFAGLGPGEVTLPARPGPARAARPSGRPAGPPGGAGRAGGPKVVGLAQRRTRAGALFQCAALLTWDPGPLVRALDLPPEAEEDLAGVAAGIGGTGDGLLAAFLAALARR